jgi:hypothetical protein
MPQPEFSEKNINVETVEDCNLLCKLIIDYLDTEECIIEKEGGNSFRIAYPEGSFINYKDTSYELTYAYFCYPSRHSIDGQKYDLEVNLYHGNFTNIDNTNKGIVAHTHYHMDTEESNQHKHFHYHLGSDADADNTPHTNEELDNENLDKKNIVTCMLFNKGQHTGSDVNKFFNQFVHHKSFKNLLKDAAAATDGAAAAATIHEVKIPVHDHWSIERILPKKRSFFMYEDTDTYIVFDTVQTISKEIIDRLYIRGIKGTGGDIHNKNNYNPTTPSRVLYRKNIEIITDPAYKKSKRAQIKDLLSLTRMSSYIPSTKTSKEYNDFSDGIINSYMGGVNTGYLTDEAKAKRVADLWEEYGQDNPIEKKWNTITDYQKIILNADVAHKYKYVDVLLETFKQTGETTPLLEDSEPEQIYNFFFNPTNFEQYILAKRGLIKLINKEIDKVDAATKKITHQKNIYDFLKTYLDTMSVPEDNDIQNLKKVIEDTPVYGEIMALRFLFEDLDIIWQKKNDCISSFYLILQEYKSSEDLTLTWLKDINFSPSDNLTKLKEIIIFQIAGEQLSRTINNEECQNWLSNETHYEGNLWKFWETPEQMDKTGSIFSNLTSTLKEKIGEGMLSYVDTPDNADNANTVTTWSSHNKCRNPGNRSAAPWCYTKNPNKRWEYCQTPYYSNILGKIVLFFVLLFIVIIAFFTVKTLFFNEYPMQFVAKLTGGILASKDTFSGTNPKPVPPK